MPRPTIVPNLNTRASSLPAACAALAAILLTAGTAPQAVAAPSADARRPIPSTTAPRLIPVATGLDNPRHMRFGSDGALYVAEAGHGGGPKSTLTYVDPTGATQYVGATGAVMRISSDGTRRIVTGLPSAANADGSQATGPTDVYPDHGLYVLMGGVAPKTRATLAASDKTAQYFNDLLLVLDGNDSAYWIPFADFAAYEAANNPDGQDVNSDPYGLAVLPGEDSAPFSPHFVVTDAGGNDVLDIARVDDIALRNVLGPRQAPYMGHDIPYQSVPTSVAVSPRGTMYVGELTGFPYPVGAANVYVMRPGRAPRVLIGGFTNIVSLALAPDGDLYVLDLSTNGLAGAMGPGAGALYRVSSKSGKATKSLIISAGLNFPTAVAVDVDGAVYVTNNGVAQDAGEIDRVFGVR